MHVNYMKALYCVQIYVNMYFEQTNFVYGKMIKIIYVSNNKKRLYKTSYSEIVLCI